MVAIVIKPILAELEKDFRAVERLNQKASFRAQRFAQRRARSLISKRVAQFNGYPVRTVRERIYTPRPNKRFKIARVYVHTLPVLARNFSKADPRETRNGATVGKVRFPGAFVFRGRNSGKLIVGRRKSRKRLPIVEPTKPIRGFVEVADSVIRIEARIAFNGEYERQMALLL